MTTNPFGEPKESMADAVFEVDLSEQTDGMILPEGEYLGKVIDIEKTTSKAGNPMWVWTFTIVDGKYSGMEFKLFTALTPAALWKLSETLMALGIGGPGEKVKFEPKEVLNTLAILHLVEDEYNGKKRNSLDKISEPAAGAGKKHEPKAAGSGPNVG